MMKKIYIFVLTFLCLLCGEIGYAQPYREEGEEEGEGYDWDTEFTHGGIHYGEFDGVLYYDSDSDGIPDTEANHDPRDNPETFDFNTDDDATDDDGTYPDSGNCNDFFSTAYPCEYEDTGDCTDYRSAAYPCDYGGPCDPDTYDECLCDPTSCEGDPGGDPTGGSNPDPCKNRIVCSGVIVNCECVTEDIAVTDTNPYVVSVNYLPNGNILIKASDGIYKKPSEFNPDLPGDRRIMNLFAALLAKELQGLDKGIIFSSKADNVASSKVPASSNGTNIYLNTNGGYSTSLDNVNNFKSIIKHEIFHVDDNRNGVPSNLSTHADVYINSFASISFKNTTDDFKLEVIKSLANYILNMDKRTDSGIYYTTASIKDKIESFNLLHLRYSFVMPKDYKTRGHLTISIKDNTTYDSPMPFNDYTPLTNEK